jgi:perosamine synthetase
VPLFPNGPPPWNPAAEAVAEALARGVADGTWNRYHGPNTAALCEQLVGRLDVRHVFPCSSGTIATELALRGLDVGPGDEVVLGGYDFPGNFRAIEAVGARPVLVDLEPNERCLDVEQALAACGPTTKAIVATHLHGGLVDMPRLMREAAERGIAVVEDACQAPGATLAGRSVGSWGDVGTFSFGGSKLLTAGRGGAVVTNRDDAAQRVKIACERGNHAFPLSELQATVLLPQLAMLDELHARRAANVQRLARRWQERAALLRAFPAVLERPIERAYYKVGCWFDAGERGNDRTQLAAAVQAEGIALDVGFRGFVGRSERRCRRVGDLTVARSAAEQTLVLHHPLLLAEAAVVEAAAEVILDLAERAAEGTLPRLATASSPTGREA